jgi:hypothetical protein
MDQEPSLPSSAAAYLESLDLARLSVRVATLNTPIGTFKLGDPGGGYTSSFRPVGRGEAFLELVGSFTVVCVSSSGFGYLWWTNWRG